MNARHSYWLIPLTAALWLITGCAGTTPANHAPHADSPTLPTANPTALSYPDAPRGEVTDNYHGVVVADPYRWLEDPDSRETRAWIEAQNRLSESYLSALPSRDSIRESLTELWDYDSYGVPLAAAGRYFFSKRTGLQNQSVLYWSTSLDGEPTVLLDPNQLSDDGTVALYTYEISNNGKYIAYGLQDAGSDWVEWHVREVDSGTDTKDHIRWSKFYGVAWSPDDSGFFYSRYPAPQEGQALTAVNLGQAVYYHRLGTPQAEDTLVFERPDEPKWGFGAEVTEDGGYMLLSVTQGTSPIHRVFYRDLSRHPAGSSAAGSKSDPNHGMIPLIDTFEARFSFIANEGPVFWFHTDLDAPRGRVIAIDVRHPERAKWREVIPQRQATLRSVNAIGGRLIGNYLRDAHSQVIVYDTSGKELSQVSLPGIGSAFGFQGRASEHETFYAFTNYVTPATVYRYDVKNAESQLFRRPKVNFDSGEYEVKQVFYQSKDGTSVPMFITHRRGLTLDGTTPTLLYAYGGFNVSLTPGFNVARAMWLKMGGVLAIPNLRGGGEYGKSWHLAGTKLQKQNVFDDFIAAAEWLIANKYTSSEKLAIEGRSNGGLLVGAAMTQRPDLFAVALPAVGVMDMLRFHKFTIGWAWIDDYGSSDNPDEFKALYAYSPYHNLEPASYPATLVTTADHDDRVVPGHSFKFTAALQAAQQGPKPTLARIETKAGHGSGKPTSMRIAEATDILAFTAAQLGLSYRPHN
ncbi:MAG: prolyl oligopeptidase family serine peptidase [Haliangiales bacterium]